MSSPTNGTYSFASEPRPVSNRKLAPDVAGDAEDRVAINIMWDKRVVRGNTLSSPPVPARPVEKQRSSSPHASPPNLLGTTRGSRRRRSRGMSQTQISVPVVECLLEEITDRPVEIVFEAGGKKLEDRPPSPLFIPQQIGVDKETQVEPGDLFDFDAEVQPLLEMIVGKTLEQSLAEVMEEDELRAKAERRDDWEIVQMSERFECERVEHEHTRREQEKARRAVQNNQREQEEAARDVKVVTQSFSHNWVGDVFSTVFEELKDSGFFYDPLVREIEEEFLPWLAEGVSASIQHYHDAEKLVEEEIKKTVKLHEQRQSDARQAYERQVEEEKRAREEEAAEAAAEAEAAAKELEESEGKEQGAPQEENSEAPET